jgi:two-component system cell cycle sensor histidine kinase/response regulator CckA
LLRADGEYRWVLDSGAPRLAPGGAFQGYIGSAIDITDLKRAQQEALDRQKLESVGALTAGIAHDFNNLLGSIIAEADLALSGLSTGQPPGEEIQRIVTIAFRASEIVRELMVFAGQETMNFEPVDVSPLVEDMLELLKVSISKHAILKADLRKDLPKITGHAAQIRQVIMNLIINASEAIGETKGVITVTTSRMTVEKDLASGSALDLPEGDWIRLEVSDTGCGMTEEQISRIFDPYFTTKLGGRGLGLAVVHGVVRTHGGLINVVSATSQGTKFQIFLPSAPQLAQQEHGLKTPAVIGDVSDTGTVLFVEDEEMLRTSVSKMLRKKGFSVVEADNGFAAIDLLRDHEKDIDVMLLDLTIPGAPSRDVVEQVHSLRPEMRIVLTSAYCEAASEPLKVPEVVAFIRKPFELEGLVQLIRKIRADR